MGNGNGIFQNQSIYHVGRRPIYLVSADFNNDQKIDLAVAHEKDNICILLGDGNGIFEANGWVTTDGGAVSLTVGDFNNDNKPDLAAVIQKYNELLVFLNQCSN